MLIKKLEPNATSGARLGLKVKLSETEEVCKLKHTDGDFAVNVSVLAVIPQRQAKPS